MKMLRWMGLLTLFIGATSSVSLAQAEVTQEKADVRVIIDISGSMKQNDPNNLRRPALDLLIKLIPEGSKAGVWTFGQYVNMLVPHRDVDASWRSEAAAKVEQVNSVGLYTNIGGALEKAVVDGGKTAAGYRTSVILLTDGMVDISRDPADNELEWRRIVDKVLPSLKSANYKIHTVALSQNADSELMNALSLNTDGIAAVAASAEELTRIFLRALAQSAPVDEVPLAENKFLVDSSIEEFTAVIFRAKPEQQTQLLSPDQKFYTAASNDPYVSWYRAADHDLITLKNPIEGEWLVRADVDPDSKITIVTNLKLLVKPMANNLFQDDTAQLQFLLQDKGKTLNDARFLRLLKISAELHLGDDLIWSETLSDKLPPGDGIYQRKLDHFQQAGNYRLSLRLDGKSFSREFNHRFAVRTPFAVSLETTEGGLMRQLKVSANGLQLDKEQTVVVAKIKDPDGRSSIKPLTLSATDNWQLALTPVKDGDYQVDLRVSAVDDKGESFEYSPPALQFSHPEGADPFVAAVTPEPEQKPEPVVEPSKIEPEPAVAEPAETEAAIVEPQAAEAEPEDNSIILYSVLALGNILIFGLAIFAYRMIMGKKKPVEFDESEFDDDPALNASEPPPLEDLASEAKLGEESEDADDLMGFPEQADGAAAVDLDSDTAAEDLAAAPENPKDEAPEFSLDDLAPSKDPKPDK